MSLFRKITGTMLIAGIFSVLLAPAALAQSALDDIKARLESEGIAVIDYSTPEGQWGSLPNNWISFLSEKGYSSLKAVADTLEDYYIGEGSITALRRDLAIAEAEKTGLTIQADINDKNDEIEVLKEDIADIEGEIRSQITIIVGDNEAGKNLIFHEVDFYFNYSKWGRLPLRIINELEGAGYLSLQDIVDLETSLEEDEELLFDDLKTNLSNNDKLKELSSDDLDLIIDSMAILQASGERQITEVARSVANTIKNLIAGLAIIWIVYAGARLVFAQGDETVITEQKRSIIYAGVGLVAILLVDRGIDFLYGPAGIVRKELTPDQGFTAEVYGLVNFLKAVIGTIAILFIVVSGVRTLFATGAEDQITKQKKSLLWIGMGLILIAIDEIIIENVFIIPTQHSDQIRTSNVTSIINTIGGVFQFLLGFVGLIAFGALIYGAATMIMNYGNDEMVQKSRKIITNAIIGIVVIISAYVIVATLVVFR
jgi:hypothetical protein